MPGVRDATAFSGGGVHLDSILETLSKLQRTRALALVGIDGLGGAGKSTLANCLCAALTHRDVAAEIVHLDDFFRPSAERSSADDGEGVYFDWLRLREQVLAPLRLGRPAIYKRYDWTNDVLAGFHQVSPAGIVVVEGVSAVRRELADAYDFRIWVECPRDIRLVRGLARDGREARARWEQEWMPAEDRYVAEHRPRDRADAVVDGTDPTVLRPRDGTDRPEA